MKRILNFLNDVDMDERTEHIIDGILDNNAITAKAADFKSLQIDQQHLYMIRLSQRIRKITKPYKLLSVLLLVDTLLKQNEQISLPIIEYPGLRLNDSKEHVILTNIAKYYEYFLKMNEANKYNRETLNAEQELEEAEEYCQLTIQKILEFIKIDFIFNAGWTRLEERKALLRPIVDSILERFREDLSILDKFIRNNLELVLQKTVKHPLAFNINHVYEKLIVINREMHKIQKVAKLYQLNPIFPRFEVDTELNRAVELQMLQRKEQRREFYRNWGKRQEAESCLDEVEVRTTESFLLLNSYDQQE